MSLIGIFSGRLLIVWNIDRLISVFGPIYDVLLRIFGSLRLQRTELFQGAHAHEVVRGHRQHEHLIDLLQAAHHHLAHSADALGPAETLFDELALLLRNRIARTLGD